MANRDPSMAVHREFMTRPDDERFLSIPEARDMALSIDKRSVEGVIPTHKLTAIPKGTDIVLTTGKADLHLTNWSSRQLSALSGIPTTLYDQPAELLAQNLTWGLRSRENEDVQILTTYKEKSDWTIRALTGPKYGRIRNHEVLSYMIEKFGDGVTGTWRVPGIRGTKLAQVDKSNSTIFLGEQDTFVFLADEENRIEVKGRRDGKPGTLARGFYFANSEVGSGKLRIGMYLYDFLCANRIIWGMEQFMEIAIRHSSGAPFRWINDVIPQIQAFSAQSAKPVEAQIKAAQQHLLGEPDQVTAFLNRTFAKHQTINMQAVHVEEEGRPVVSRWDAVTAATAYAKTIPYQNERFVIEKKAGDLLAA